MALEYLQTTNFQINTQIASYIVQYTDAIPVIKLIQMNVGTANTLTVPNDATLNFQVGTKLFVTQVGAGATTVTGGVGVTIYSQSNSLTLIRYEVFEIVKVASDTWILQGLNTLANPSNNNFLTFGGTQWSTVSPAVVLPTGNTANGFGFFTDGASKVAAGTTSYDEYNIWAGRTLTLTGTSGTANILILGVNYLATFNTTLTQTAADFVTLYQATLLALGVQVYANAGVLKFGRVSDLAGGSAALTAITITTLTGNLNGTFGVTSNDHTVIPYLTRPYNGLRLNHIIRINFNIDVGNLQYYALSLRRWQNDTTIGSIIQVSRNTSLTGQQFNFVSYTAGATDPFVTGGFYFAFENQSGQNVTISGAAGILIETYYQKPCNFY